MKLNNPNKKEESTISLHDSDTVELDVTIILEQLGIDSSGWSLTSSLQPNNRTQNKTKP